MNYSFRNASGDDIAAMVTIEKAVNLSPWSQASFQESLDKHFITVMEYNNSLIGYVIHSQVFDEVELLNIAIDPQHQKKGLGTKMLNQLINSCRAVAKCIYLEVRASNQPAISLYKKSGFKQTGVRKNYYPLDRGREDAVVMTYEY